ncbi:MAG: 30S ribosomal protein S6 [Leptospirillia bacterium]
MNCYETVFILHPELGEEAVAAAKGKVDESIGKTGGRIYSRENWGRKRLAYTVAKQTRGTYLLVRFIGDGSTVAELERMFRLDEAFLKFMTVRLTTDPATVPEAEDVVEEMIEKPDRMSRPPRRDDRGSRDDRDDRDDRPARPRSEAKDEAPAAPASNAGDASETETVGADTGE